MRNVRSRLTTTGPRTGKAAAATALALGLLTALTTPAHAQGPVHGCPSGDGCVYKTQADYNNNSPSAKLSLKVTATYLGFPITIIDVDVNNSDAPAYTSEGKFVLRIPGVLCVYVPDDKDVQAPDTIENPADGAMVNAMAVGATKADVEAIAVVALSNCGS
ncbi:hypothetical protein [Streptomyces luteireticuli]|uniref:hypothetical protein n=1 Tax=Streptomyces luteireticuli TaxID=173858 RepID=UPI0035591343